MAVVARSLAGFMTDLNVWRYTALLWPGVSIGMFILTLSENFSSNYYNCKSFHIRTQISFDLYNSLKNIIGKRRTCLLLGTQRSIMQFLGDARLKSFRDSWKSICPILLLLLTFKDLIFYSEIYALISYICC